MVVKSGFSSFSCVATTRPAPFRFRGSSQLSLSQGSYDNEQYNVLQLRYAKVKSCQFPHRMLKLEGKIKRKYIFSATTAIKTDASEEENHDPDTEDISTVSTSFSNYEGTGGKPGLISFYNHPYKREDEILVSFPKKNPNNLLWFIGPAVLVASFIFPSLYLRKLLSTVFEDSLLTASTLWFIGPAVLVASFIFPSLYLRKLLSTVFEDSLLTDFLILFFTEALFYCGVAVFLLITDNLRRPVEALYASNSNRTLAPQLGDRISSVVVLVLSLIIPMVTMGLVWPWTGPAASATLAPYLVGIVVQFAFEQYARYSKSPSWSAIPIIFQVYRLHQLNRAAQLVTALSFTVRGAEMTSHNVAINSSLGTLLNVLQFLGVICIWSLSSFIMRFFPASAMIEH